MTITPQVPAISGMTPLGFIEKTQNHKTFEDTLTAQYVDLFQNNPDYAYSASQLSPSALSEKMTMGLITGKSNKDGEGIKRTVKQLGIKNTYKAIREYLLTK